MKCTRDCDMPTALAVSRIVTFETFVLPVTVKRQPDFASPLMDSVPVLWYLIRPINFSQFSKILLYQMTELCANFFISYTFFNILVSNHFYNSGIKICSITITITLKQC